MRYSIPLILFFVCLVGIAVFWVVITLPSSVHPQFTIYQNECVNKSGNYDGYKCEDGSRWLPIETYYKEIVLPNGIRCYPNNDTYSTQVCSQKEVQEIEYGEYFGKEYKCINEKDGIVFYITTEPMSGIDRINCKLIRDEGRKTISKQDLTISFLDENCEVARCTPCEDLSCKNQKCDLYYCGDYEVEVKQ